MPFLDKLRREFIQVTTILRTLRRMSGIKPESEVSFADIVEHWAAKTPEAIAIYFESRRYSYRDYDRAGNQYARWAEAQRIGRGDCVALLMENRPEYLFACLGLAKRGAVVELINTNLRGEALAHCIEVTGATQVILGAELSDAWTSALPHMTQKPQIWVTGGALTDTQDLDVELSCHSPEPLAPGLRAGFQAKERFLQVFTSGTTGMPKAANISHLRFLSIANSFSAFPNATSHDRMYLVLPLYHSSGGVAALGAVLTVGGAVILRRRFSAKAFWEDCRHYEATLFQYIGELCRYLLNCPVDPQERNHKIRCIMGNGLRPDIWMKFKDRFAIPRIVEFYGSTEGNVSLVNADGTPGAVGRIPSYLAHLFHVKIVAFDIETGDHPRGTDGFCREAAPGEIGEAIGKIEEGETRGVSRFEGYSDKSATEQKILRNVFEAGDAWFRTGDLMKKDAEGYFYFVDRIGDTFRWKGENVATGEVAQVLSTFPGVREANVYGVHIPGTDGRAGMAALVIDPTLDLNALHRHIEQSLPAYARPLFLRLQPFIEATGTFKQKKGELVAAGFDPATTPDRIFFDHPKQRGYVPLDSRLYGEICAGGIRL
jgi:fatty-acyl-CoA synthase